jgi:hypothetical protein
MTRLKALIAVSANRRKLGSLEQNLRELCAFA